MRIPVDAVLEEGKSILELIEDARREAVRNGIKANSIVINRGLVKVIGDNFMFPDMICGLKSYVTATELPEDYAFAVLHDPNREPQPELRWIPVTERLPEKDGEYLTVRTFDDRTRYSKILDFTQKGIDVWGGDLDGEENVFYYYYDGDYISVDNVTHWMPIPEPPKGE